MRVPKTKSLLGGVKNSKTSDTNRYLREIEVIFENAIADQSEAEYLVPNEWDLTCYKLFKSYLTPSKILFR